VVNKRLKQNWEYEEKNLVLHLNYSFHNYLRLQWALRQFVGNALGNGNPLGKFKVPLTSVCLSSPSGWTSHLLNNPLAKLLHGSTSSGSGSQGQITHVDHNDGQFFRAMEWLMFFFRPPLTSMVFQWFWQRWTITIECFLRAQPLVSMVFRWFSKFWGQWSTMVLRLAMVWMYHWTLKVRKINFRQNTNFEQHFPHGEHDSEMIDHYFYFQILKCRTEEQFKWIIEEETRLLYNSMQND